MSHRVRKWFEKNLISRDRLRGEKIHKLLGDRILASEIWQINRFSIAGGLALGLFVAFTPTIPFQMTISALCALWLRVNLPVALAACWVTNPLTIIPVYSLAFKLGQAILQNLPGTLFTSPFKNYLNIRDLFTKAAYLWTGGVLLGSIAALVGYTTVRLLWYFAAEKEKTRRKKGA